MTKIRDILANNLKENRRKCGISQAKLAEKADISTQYIAMIELSRKFPTPEMLDRIAKALDIEAHELFSVPPGPEEALERLHQEILVDIERVVGEAVERAVAGKCKEQSLS
jgi:transcriptional regulator with XRE-family HTH domain